MTKGRMLISELLLSMILLASWDTVPMAQVVGEYRSNAPTPSGGNWSKAGTWQTWNGSSWVAATTSPSGSEPKLTIQSTDSVYVDQAVTITDTLYNQGKINGGTSLTVGNGGVYQHAQNGGSIPTATWNTGSTCLVTGVTSSGPSNTNQNFYNFTWNCPAQSANVNVGWQTGVSIAGTLTCTSTNWNHSSTSSPSYQLRLFGAAGSCIINNVVVNGYGAVLTPMGSGFNDTVTVNGNITLSKGSMLSLSNNSGGVGIFYVKGNISVIDSTYIGKSNSGNLSKMVFVKAGVQNLSHTTPGVITYFGAPNFMVSTGSTLNLDTVMVGGAGSFVVSSGATLIIRHPSGLNGNITTNGSNGGGNSFSSSANYVYSGSASQVTGSMLPHVVNNLTISDSSGVSLSSYVSVTDTLGLTSGNLFLDTNYVIAGYVLGGSSTSFVSTDSASSYLEIPSVGSNQVSFPVGTASEGFSPVWITNSGTADTFSVSAAADTASAVGGGRVKVRWNISESVPGNSNCSITFGWMASAENGTFAASRSSYAQIYNFTGTTFKLAGSGAYSSQFTTQPYTLTRAGFVTLGSFVVGKFALGASLSVGDYGSVQSGNWSALSTWKQWDGTGWDTVPTVVPEGGVNVFINKGDTVTVDAVDSVGGNLVVDGYIKDVAALKTSGANVIFDSASSYELAYNGGSVPGIPTATWKTGSTCLITGSNGTISSTTGYNANQNFYNLTINAAFTSNKDLAMYNNVISGNLLINNTGNSRVQLTSPGAGTPNAITIDGNLILTAGQFSSNGSSSSGDITINCYGNITATGGSNFSISRGSGPTVRWNFYGDSLTLSNATTQTSGSSDVFVFAKHGNQYLKLDGATFGSGGIPIEVDTGAVLFMGTSSIGGSGNFAVDSGATIASGDTTGLNGNITTSGTLTFNPGASFVFNGNVAQTTGTLLPTTFRNLTVNNSRGVTLTRSVVVTGNLAMTSGILMLDTNTVTASSVTGGSATSYLSTDSARSSLTVPLVDSTQVIFPIGTKSGYAPVWITNPITPDGFSVSVKPDSANTTNGLGRVKVKWNIVKSHYLTTGWTMQFGWMASEEDSVFAQHRADYAKIYLLTDTLAIEQGTGSYTTQSTTQPYTVSRGGITGLISGSVPGVARFGTVFVVGHFTTTDVNEQAGVPMEFKLSQNYPNPFNPTTKVEFTVAKKGMTMLTIYDILGQKVATLFSGVAQPGRQYSVDFNGGTFASGIYFSVLQSDGQRQIKKMVLMK